MRPGVTVADREIPGLMHWGWHADGTRPTGDLDLLSITGMEEAGPPEERLAALSRPYWTGQAR